MGRPDAELIAAARAGDTAAFGQIVARYQPAVVAVAYAAVRDRVLAEDIAQDAFVTAWTKLAGLRDVERLPAWLCGIARNVARARRRVRGREVPANDVAAEATSDATPYTALDDAQREAALAAALDRVPATYREPLVLFYCEQQSAQDVARVLGVSDAAVHQRLSRARTMLANDAELVEHSGRRSRRDLAAAVLAAIAIGFGSSRVDAHQRPRARPRGTSMLKLAAVGIIAALAGTTYVVAHASGSASAAPVASAAPAPSFANARPSARTAGFARMAATLAAVTSGARAAAAVPSLDCATVGHHMAEMALAGQPQMPTWGPAQDDIVGQIAPHFTAACNQQHWTQEYMACILGGTDMMSAGFDCAPYSTSQGAPFSFVDDAGNEPPGAVKLPARTEPVPPTTDTSCAGIGRHLAEMSMPDPAAIAALPDGQREMIQEGITNTLAAMPAQIERGCTDSGWTEERRTCLAAATTAAEMMACN